MSDPREVAARAAALAGRDALAAVIRERSVSLRFSRSRPTQATAIDDLTVDVAVIRGGQVGRATTNGTDQDALARCCQTAVDAAEAAVQTAGEGRFPGFPPLSAVRPHHGHDVATARLDPGQGSAALSAAFGACAPLGAHAYGLWTAAEVETAIASSDGAMARDRVTDAHMKVIAMTPSGRSGYAAQTSVAVGDLDPVGLARRAGRKATAGDELLPLESGAYTVVMEPEAVAEVLRLLGRTAFNGLAHAEERGALVGRLGTRVASPAINLSDSPRHPSTLPRAFDAEGTPKAPIPLIQDGVAHRVVHDTASAAAAGGSAASTGHAAVAGGGGQDPIPTNMVLVGGGAADEQALCQGVRRGVYITRLWYSNVIAAHDSMFTAMTRDGTFLIEDGQITQPLEEMRLTDSALGLLARVEALGAASVLASDGEFYGRRFASGTVCPPLRAHDVPLASAR